MTNQNVVIRRGHRNNGYMLTMPNGDICWQPSKDFAAKYAQQWLQQHDDAGKIEWKAE